MGGSSEPSTPSASPHNSYPDQRDPNNAFAINYNSFAPAAYAPAAYAAEAQPAPVDPTNQQHSPVMQEVTIDKEAKEQQENNLKQYLLNIFYLINVATIMLWVLVGAGFPWFFYVSFAASFVECIIYGAKTKNYLFISTSIYVNITIMDFLTYLATGGGYPWFIYPTISLALIPGIHYLVKYYRQDRKFWLLLHLEFYVVANSICFFAWMISSLYNPYPWFIFPISGWGILLLVHYNAAVMHDPAKLMFFLAIDLGTMVTVAIRFALGAAGIVLPLVACFVYGVYYVMKNKGLMCFKNKQPLLPLQQQPTAQPVPQQPPVSPYQQTPEVMYAPQTYNFQPQSQYYPNLQFISQPGPYQPVQFQQPQPQEQPQQQQMSSQSSFYSTLPGYQVLATTAAGLANKLQDHFMPSNPTPTTPSTTITPVTTTTTTTNPYDSNKSNEY